MARVVGYFVEKKTGEESIPPEKIWGITPNTFSPRALLLTDGTTRLLDRGECQRLHVFRNSRPIWLIITDLFDGKPTKWLVEASRRELVCLPNGHIVIGGKRFDCWASKPKASHVVEND